MTKFPNPNKTPMTNTQARANVPSAMFAWSSTLIGIWSLGSGISLGFGPLVIGICELEVPKILPRTCARSAAIRSLAGLLEWWL
jgi:hypothetical protein